MEKYKICNTHQKKVKFVFRDSDSNELIRICSSCLPLPENQPYQSIKNVEIDIENNKILIIKHLEEEFNHNVKTLRKLIEYLNNYKKTQVEQIDQIIKQGEQEIKQIEKKCLHSQNQIKEYDASIEVEQLIILYNTLQTENSLDKTKTQLLDMLIQLQQQSFLFQSYGLLQQLHFPFNLELPNRDSIINNKRVYKCLNHNQILIGVDLNKSYIQINDAICLNCINSENVSFTKCNDAENMWREYHQRSKICQENLKNQVIKLSSKAINQIQEKYIIAQSKLQVFLSVLQNYQNSQLNKQSQQLISLDYTSAKHLQQLKKISRLSLNDWSIFEREVNIFNQILDQKQIKITYCLYRLNEFIQRIKSIQIDQIKLNKIQFEQLSVVKQIEYCRAIAFNSEGNILVAGCNEKINMFQFNCGFLDKLQTLDGHTNYINCLQFMKNQDIFVSAGNDKQLKFAKSNQIIFGLKLKPYQVTLIGYIVQQQIQAVI